MRVNTFMHLLEQEAAELICFANFFCCVVSLLLSVQSTSFSLRFNVTACKTRNYQNFMRGVSLFRFAICVCNISSQHTSHNSNRNVMILNGDLINRLDNSYALTHATVDVWIVVLNSKLLRQWGEEWMQLHYLFGRFLPEISALQMNT